MMVSVGRVIRFAFQNFWRNAWLSFATISILVLTLLSVNFFVALNALFEHALLTVERQVNITVHFQQTVPDDDIQRFLQALRDLPAIKSAELRSKEEALERFRTAFEEDQHIQESLKELERNPLPTSIIIRAKEISGYDEILAFINDSRHKETIERSTFDDRTAFIERIQNLKINAQTIGAGVTVFFAIVAVLIVMNTIRMTIYSRRREVGIMKLVGATNHFIRAPLFLESILYSVIGVAVTIIIVFPLVSSLQPSINALFEQTPFDLLGFFSENFSIIFGTQLLALLILNIFSSSIAIGRYLKV